MKYLSIFIIALALIVPLFSFAQSNLGYQPLAPLPNTTVNCTNGTGQCIDLENYIPSIFTLLIGLAGVLAVLKIVIGGVKYLSTDAIGGKSEGKNEIISALTGLLLIIASYIILNTINPATLNLNLTLARYNPPAVTRDTTPTTTPTGGAGNPATRCATNNPCADANACPAGRTCGADASCGLICYPPVSSCPGGTCNCPNCVVVGPSATESGFTGLPISAGTNQIDRAFAQRLMGLSGLNQGNPPTLAWTITEAYPPTRVHAAECHRQGTCIDADVLNPTTANVSAFYNQARGIGLRVVYETSDPAEFNRLRAVGIPEYRSGGSGVQLLPQGTGRGQISGNHFSIYNQ